MMPHDPAPQAGAVCGCLLRCRRVHAGSSRGGYLENARRLGFGLKIHAEQFSRTGAARLAVELEAVSADHLEQAGEEDIRALAQSNTIATLLPGSVFHLALRTYAPARALIEAGAAVALATDFNPGTSPTYSMQMVLSLACTEMRMSPAEAIAAATINGAHALGCARPCGIARARQAGRPAGTQRVGLPRTPVLFRLGTTCI